MNNRILRSALIATITLGTPTLAAAANHPTAAETTKAPKAAASDTATSYSQRESTDPKAGDFQGGFIESSGGGGVVVISGAALALVLIVAILVL